MPQAQAAATDPFEAALAKIRAGNGGTTAPAPAAKPPATAADPFESALAQQRGVDASTVRTVPPPVVSPRSTTTTLKSPTISAGGRGTAGTPGVPQSTAGRVVRDLATGAAKQIGQTATGLVELLPYGGPVLDAMYRRWGLTDRTAALQGLERVTTAEKVGAFGAEVGEFAVPATKIARGAKLLGYTPKIGAAVEGAGQAVAAGTLATAQGSDSPATAAAISGIIPIIGQRIAAAAPRIAASAKTQLANAFRESEQTGEQLLHPRIERTIAQAVDDLLELPLQWSWKGLQQATGAVRQAEGETLEAALRGELGLFRVDKAPIANALKDFVEDTAQHMIKVEKGQYSTAVYNRPNIRAAKELQSTLAQYPDTLSAQQLHDIKRVWDKAVFFRSNEPVGSIRERLTTASKEAMNAGADAIRRVLQVDVPEVAALDEAVSHAIHLDALVKNLAANAYRLPPAAENALSAISGFAGASIGGSLTPGSYAGHIGGLSTGFAVARMLSRALASPLWRTVTPVAKDRIAKAIVAGRTDQVRLLLAPVLVAGAPAPTPSAAAVSLPPTTPGAPRP